MTKRPFYLQWKTLKKWVQNEYRIVNMILRCLTHRFLPKKLTQISPSFNCSIIRSLKLSKWTPECWYHLCLKMIWSFESSKPDIVIFKGFFSIGLNFWIRDFGWVNNWTPVSSTSAQRMIFFRLINPKINHCHRDTPVKFAI